MYKKVFIIGNGFDLDLGLKTRYADFAGSKYWPDEYSFRFSRLGDRLNHEKQLNKWLDLELLLKKYSEVIRGSLVLQTNPVEDRTSFSLLCDGLTQYLQDEQEKAVKTDSVAAVVLKAIIQNGYFNSIYSYNYTDLYKIAEKLKISKQFDYANVHGKLQDNSIILGVTDRAELREGYSFLYKTFSSHYKSYPVQYDLLEADEVVFFGHSLGENDYHYFQAFFRKQCDERMERKQSKKITFFTYDDASHIQIMEQLHQMNEKKTNLLFGLNDLQFIYTSEGLGSGKLRRFLKHLEDESEAAEHRKLECLEPIF